jgi:hypothetical protein
MRYFLKDFHKAWNSGDIGSDLVSWETDFGFSKAKQKRLAKQESINRNEYFRSLAQLERRLGPAAWNFFFPSETGEGLHDATLLSFEAGDAIDAPVDGIHPINPKRYRHSVRMRFLNYDRDRILTFKYFGVVGATFDFPSSDPLHYKRGGGIGDQLVDEVVSLDDKTLRHEHYFASGAEIRVDFERLALTVRRIKRK